MRPVLLPDPSVRLSQGLALPCPALHSRGREGLRGCGRSPGASGLGKGPGRGQWQWGEPRRPSALQRLGSTPGEGGREGGRAARAGPVECAHALGQSWLPREKARERAAPRERGRDAGTGLSPAKSLAWCPHFPRRMPRASGCSGHQEGVRGAARSPAPQAPYLQHQGGHHVLAQADNRPHRPPARSHILGCREGHQDLRREKLLVCLGKWWRVPEQWLCPSAWRCLCTGVPLPDRRDASGTAADSQGGGWLLGPTPAPSAPRHKRLPKWPRNLQGGLHQGGWATARGEGRRGVLQGWAPLARRPRPSSSPPCCPLGRRA